MAQLIDKGQRGGSIPPSDTSEYNLFAVADGARTRLVGAQKEDGTMPKAFYSSNEVAEMMGISLHSAQAVLRRLAEKGMAMKIGNRYRVRMTVFKKWLEEQGAGAA